MTFCFKVMEIHWSKCVRTLVSAKSLPDGCLVSLCSAHRRYAWRTRRWRFWWIRWGTCCGTSTPCWRSGSTSPAPAALSFLFERAIPPQTYGPVELRGHFCLIWITGPFSFGCTSFVSALHRRNSEVTRGSQSCYLFLYIEVVGGGNYNNRIIILDGRFEKKDNLLRSNCNHHSLFYMYIFL